MIVPKEYTNSGNSFFVIRNELTMFKCGLADSKFKKTETPNWKQPKTKANIQVVVQNHSKILMEK